MAGRVLIVEDEGAQARALRGHLEADGHEVLVAEDGATALGHLDRGLDLVLCDLRLPDMDGLEIFRRVREALGDDSPTFVILTAYGTVESARAALKSGVYDYLTKPVDPTELTFLIKNVLDQRRLRRENRELSRAAGKASIGERLRGQSEPFRAMVELARNAAESEATILIRGESGTGKELVAELIHASSPRARGPFVKVNCGAIPETLLEAELFGHERGAFTDARKARKGRFELAHGGTIFLDEIGEMSPALQVKLLRVLQERELERIGGQGQVIPLDIRLMAATNQDLETMVREGTFREDLYYRINVITIPVPPLRERPGDVELLAGHFCARFTARNKKAFRGISPEAMERLRAHRWPGNVRELENVVERAVVLGQGEWIRPEHLVDGSEAMRPPSDGPRRASSGDQLVRSALDSGTPLDQWERELIRKALERTGGNVTQAARLLGLTRRTLQYRIEKHRIGKDAVRAT
ncbi:MAG: sigma-54 dependent transcriptional regulator [Planctomycetes bacterium]|nr:sigma-54 dependent transcriptional regulator [Planctomycetota bacterium]